MVRIPGFHPGDQSSIPGQGTKFSLSAAAHPCVRQKWRGRMRTHQCCARPVTQAQLTLAVGICITSRRLSRDQKKAFKFSRSLPKPSWWVILDGSVVLQIGVGSSFLEHPVSWRSAEARGSELGASLRPCPHCTLASLHLLGLFGSVICYRVEFTAKRVRGKWASVTPGTRGCCVGRSRTCLVTCLVHPRSKGGVS